MNPYSRLFNKSVLFLGLLILFCFYSGCKKKNSDNPLSEKIEEKLGVKSLNDTVFDMKGSMPFFFLDLDEDRNADFLMQYTIDDEQNHPGMTFITLAGSMGVRSFLSLRSFTFATVCINDGDTTRSVETNTLMQNWNFSGQEVSASDTANTMSISMLFHDTNPPFQTQNHCLFKYGSKAGDNNEGYIVVRKLQHGKMKMGWVKCRYNGDTAITFISYKKLMEVATLKLP